MTTTPTAARVSGTIKALEWLDDGCCAKRLGIHYHMSEGEPGMFELTHPFHSDPMPQAECQAAAQANYNARILAAIQPDPEPVSTTKQNYGDCLSSDPEPQPVIGMSLWERLSPVAWRVFDSLPGPRITREEWMRRITATPSRADMPTALRYVQTLTTGGAATPSSAGMVSVEAAPDHQPFDIPEMGNYYGNLSLKRENGKDFWSIENYDGHYWVPCDPAVASALRALSGEGER